MIKIFSIFLNISALILGFYSLFFILGRVNSFETGNERVAQIEKEAVTISQQREKVKKDNAMKFSKERSKNQLLEEEKFEAEREFSNQNKALEKIKNQIQALEQKSEALKGEISDAKLKLLSGAKSYEKLSTDFESAKLRIPDIEELKINSLRNIEEVIFEMNNLAEIKSSYASETELLKSHYDRTLDSLMEDKASRDWLEEGEKISVPLLSLDLENGFLGILGGKEQGIYESKLFAVVLDGVQICKLRIVRSELDKSVAAILPLIGEPSKLLKLDEIVLYHL
jgi:predicted RNase H-like nuclease (RuvC/YqgF family)